MNKIILYSFIVISLLLTSQSALAWKVPVEIATTADDGGKIYNRLVIGIELDATDGFDNLWDTPALISHPDPDRPILLRAYINGKGGASEEARYLWKDIRGPLTKGETKWEIIIDPIPAGRSVVISWNLPQGILKADERFKLKDNNMIGPDGKPGETDLTQSSSYVFVSNSGEARSLSLVLLRESTDSPSSGSGSGFGCGTIGLHKNRFPHDGAALINIIVLFLPLLFIKLLRLTRSRLSI